MAQYNSAYPSLDVDPAYKQFFVDFYKISDTPEAHQLYSEQFTKDATLVMASKKAQGTSEIKKTREAMWEKVSSRSHHPVKVFPFGANSNEVMLYGTVEYGLKAGGSASKDWGARAVLTKEEGAVKMSFYQVYLDTAS